MHLKRSNKRQKFEFEAIGTRWIIECGLLVDFSKITNIIADFDQTFSRFRDDSLVSQIARKGGKYKIPDPKLMNFYEELYKKTGGLVTPLIGSTLEEAGYDKNYSLISKGVKRPKLWEESLLWNEPMLSVKTPVVLDFGAAGKGRLIDLVAEELKRQGELSFVIDAGGDILVSASPTTIGLENPLDHTQIIGRVEITSGSLAASSGNRRKWGKWHHIINPTTLTPASRVLGVWTRADSAMVADGLATCLFFCEPEKLKSTFDFEFLILYPDFSVKMSQGFGGELYEAS